MNLFTKTLAAINLLGAVVSIGMFVATFFAEGFIVRKAKDHALDVTRERLKPVITFLENPALVGKLPAPVEKRLAKELADYRKDPEKWLLEIAGGDAERAKSFEFPEVRNPLVSKGLGFISHHVSQAPERLKLSLANLISDLRIFCGTNACAFLVAAGLCIAAKTRKMRHWLGAWSVLLLVSTLFGSWAYVSQNWAWSVVFNSYYGWSYASMNILLALYLFSKLEPSLKAHEPARND